MTGAARAAVPGWLLVASVYFLAVFNRSTLGVAGLQAEHRFGIGPGALSVFVMLQIGVYAAMQVPTGVLVDRYGPRRLLITAAAVMAVAQAGFALAPSFPLALLCRALLGCGDALTFVSVLRYTATHFSARRYPLLVALTAALGTVGNILATAPLSALLHGLGWRPSFLIASVASAGVGLAVASLVRDATLRPRAVRGVALRAGVVRTAGRVRDAWSISGTRLGFWLHFACMSTATPFSVLWGHPYLVDGVGFSTSGASRVLMTGIIVLGIATPTVGFVTGRWPVARIPLSLGVCALTIVGLLVLSLGLGDRPPRGAVIAIFIIALLGSPASMTAFSVARDYNPYRTLGTASGVVNVGGFVATVIGSVLFGAVLDLVSGSDRTAMRDALLCLVSVQLFGTSRLVVWYLRVRAEVAERQRAGHPVPVPVGKRHWFDLRELEGPAVERIELSDSVNSP